LGERSKKKKVAKWQRRGESINVIRGELQKKGGGSRGQRLRKGFGGEEIGQQEKANFQALGENRKSLGKGKKKNGKKSVREKKISLRNEKKSAAKSSRETLNSHNQNM